MAGWCAFTPPSPTHRPRCVRPSRPGSVPAGVLAGLFLANDAFRMVQGTESSKIAHSAHLGGALLGAVWFGLRRL